MCIANNRHVSTQLRFLEFALHFRKAVLWKHTIKRLQTYCHQQTVYYNHLWICGAWFRIEENCSFETLHENIALRHPLHLTANFLCFLLLWFCATFQNIAPVFFFFLLFLLLCFCATLHFCVSKHSNPIFSFLMFSIAIFACYVSKHTNFLWS